MLLSWCKIDRSVEDIAGLDAEKLPPFAIAPLWHYLDSRRLKHSPCWARKIRYYKTFCGSLRTATQWYWPSLGFRPLFTTSPAPDEASWLFEHALTRYLLDSQLS